jgi:hypothetical protein
MTKTHISTTLFFTLAFFAASSLTTSAQTLPAKVKSYLDKSYSGWKMTGSNRNCSDTKRYIATGDFNGDTKTDYAVKFVRGRKGYVLGFVAQGTHFKAHILENTSATDIKSIVLSVSRKGEEYYVTDDGSTRRLPKDAPYTVPCESDAVNYYFYRNGKFQ